ncbi:P-loop NTPase fold protein [Clostridium thermobutyricum]|uniref:P-loop NTPase fold protein n=1 Tax=Clostridium thermobutyricum TaxID=29372 RepID=UPI0018A962F5|nr:P-loop NTPase fold protein [Clostridium thermobutyricum]
MFNNNLNDENIIDIINDYVEEECVGGAILIDGEWGTGKTYFIENKVIKELQDKGQKVIYISLYGMTSILDIEKELLINTIPLLKTGKKVPKFIWELLSCGINLKTGINLDDYAQKFEEAFLNSNHEYTRYVIIFDDLERCNIPINSVLGYINKLVEHEKQKVIIIANEKELNKNNFNENKELKYINAYEIFKDNIKENGYDEKKNLYNKEALDELVKEIYFNNDYYDEVKEKLIYQTIKYNPNKHAIMSNMISSSKADGEILNILESNKELIIDIFDLNKYFNARTARHVIIKLKSILSKIDSTKLEMYKENEVIENIIKSTTQLIIEMKKSNINHLDKAISEIILIKLGTKYSLKSAYIVKSIIIFLNTSFIDISSLNKELNSLAKELIKLNEDLNKGKNLILTNYILMSEEAVKNNFKEIKSKVENKDKNININELKVNIDYFYMLYKDINIITKEELNELVIGIGELIESRPDNFNDITLINSDCYPGYENDQEHIEMLKKLNSYEPRGLKQIIEEETKEIFDENKVLDLARYISDKNDYFFNYKGFLKYFDINKIIIMLEKSNNLEKRKLAEAIFSRYSFSNVKDYFEGDKEYIEDLISGLNSLKCDDKIGKFNIKIFINWLKSVLEHLN